MRKPWGPYLVIPVDQPTLEELGWEGFALLDHAIRKVRPDYQVAELVEVERVTMPTYRRLVFMIDWVDCSTCQGKGTSWDESTGGKCWDCRGGGRLPS